jgi:thymidylate kinase
MLVGLADLTAHGRHRSDPGGDRRLYPGPALHRHLVSACMIAARGRAGRAAHAAGGKDFMDTATTAPPVHPLIRDAFKALDAAGGRWALLRGARELSHPSGDLDILADAKSHERIDAALGSAGFMRVPRGGHGTHTFYLGYDADDDAWLELDIVTGVEFGRHQEYRMDLAPLLLSRRQRVGEVSLLEPSDGFWHVVLHDLLGRGEIPVRRRSELERMATVSTLASPVAQRIEDLRRGLPAELLGAVLARRWETVHRLGSVLRLRWRMRDPRIGALTLLRLVQRRLPCSSARGLSLAILGPDGAGKTTLADGVRARIPLPSKYVYLGIWRPSRFDHVLRRVLGARLAVRIATLLSKAVLIAYHRRRGRLVVLDRYTCDADLPVSELDLKGRVSAMLLRRTCPEPDLILLLDAPVELMYARKGELGLTELQLRRDGYLSMLDKFRDMVIVDAALPLDEVRRQATALLWDRWARSSAGSDSRAVPTRR